MLERILIYTNLILILFLPFLLNKKQNTLINIILSFLTSLYFVSECISLVYIAKLIGRQSLYFIFNLHIFHFIKSTAIMMIYFFILLFFILWFALFKLLGFFKIKKYNKQLILFVLLIFCLPYGCIYNIVSIPFEYAITYIPYKNATYKDIFKKVHNVDYIDKNNIKILNNDDNHKNLVIIYLESYEQAFIEEEHFLQYTQNLNKLAKTNEYYKNIEQLDEAFGTVPAIFTTQCGIEYNYISILNSPYLKINTQTQLACLGDILQKAGYNQMFIGGANKILFNKGNFLLSHGYNTVYDDQSLISEYKDLATKLNDWGVADIDVFNIAKDKYIELSKQNKPFNLTLLTTSTHNPFGIHDRRCKNSTDNILLNAVECTNSIVHDFIQFLQKQDNYKNTVILILPDHLQYNANSLSKYLKNSNRKLFTIFIDGSQQIYDNTIDYTNLSEIILNKINVKSNAVFFKNKGTKKEVVNFIDKIHANLLKIKDIFI